MSTPEGKVKAQVKRILAKFPIYGWWPVPSGYGESSLDFVGCVAGLFFAIETKAPGKKPTPRQQKVIHDMEAAGATVFVIDGKPEQLKELEMWLLSVGYFDQK